MVYPFPESSFGRFLVLTEQSPTPGPAYPPPNATRSPARVSQALTQPGLISDSLGWGVWPGGAPFPISCWYTVSTIKCHSPCAALTLPSES